jgi:hypothetical protein
MIEEYDQLPLYHGLRSKKTPEQIKKEGFCTFATPIDARKNIIDSLKFFGKEKLLTVKGGKGYRVRGLVEEVNRNLGQNRLNIWATTDKDAGCRWWAHANPEHVSLALDAAGVEPENIDKYLNEKFGRNCYNIKLKIKSMGENFNFNTGLNCIRPNLIESIEECKECKYTRKEHII